MAEQTIIRSPHGSERPYVATSRASAQNRSLSWEARGVLWYLLSKPDDWKVKAGDLEQNCGRDKVRSILNELISFGHLERVKQEKRSDGTFRDVEYRVHETPLPEKPYSGRPDSGQAPLLHNKEEHTTEEHKTDRSGDAGTPPQPTPKLQWYKHPAVQVYREEVHRYPAKSWYQTIVEAVGDNTDKWRGIVRDWIGSGWNPGNVKGMLDVFQNGWQKPVGGNGKTAGTPGTIPAGMEKQHRSDIKELTPEQAEAIKASIRKQMQEAGNANKNAA
jgi:hypothetical protein